jgi:DNA polymerase
MKQLSIDIETYSSTNLNQTGVYRYADSDDFELLLFGYAVDFGPVKVVDLTQGEKIPPQIIQALDDPAIIKSAFNAQFERVCLSRFVGHRLKPAGWHCSRVWSATLGLPLSLRDVGSVLGLTTSKDHRWQRTCTLLLHTLQTYESQSKSHS